MAHNRLTSTNLFEQRMIARSAEGFDVGCCQASPPRSSFGVAGFAATVGGSTLNPLTVPAWALPIYEAALLTARMRVRNRKVLEAALSGSSFN
ncbi:MAG: hypothetical protein C0478_18500 [Planctomyces sp.]|nr:hypothetical protein [Planctomyces sp.]